MSLFHGKHAKTEPVPDRTWDVSDRHGVTRRYVTADFDEFLTSADHHEANRHAALGWLLLDEFVLPGKGPEHEELRLRPVSAGGPGGQRFEYLPVKVPSDLPQFFLGHPKPGATGTLMDGSVEPA